MDADARSDPAGRGAGPGRLEAVRTGLATWAAGRRRRSGFSAGRRSMGPLRLHLAGPAGLPSAGAECPAADADGDRAPLVRPPGPRRHRRRLHRRLDPARGPEAAGARRPLRRRDRDLPLDRRRAGGATYGRSDRPAPRDQARQPLQLHRRAVLLRAARPLAAGAGDGRRARSRGHTAGGGRHPGGVPHRPAHGRGLRPGRDGRPLPGGAWW